MLVLLREFLRRRIMQMEKVKYLQAFFRVEKELWNLQRQNFLSVKRKYVQLSKINEKQMCVGEKPFSKNSALKYFLKHFKCSPHTFWISSGYEKKIEFKAYLNRIVRVRRNWYSHTFGLILLNITFSWSKVGTIHLSKV